MNVKGRLSNRMLPSKERRKCRKGELENSILPETRRSGKSTKRRQPKYLVSSSAAKILQVETKHASTVGKEATLELSNDDLDCLLLILRTTYGNVAGLEPLGLGQCIKGRSFPQFSRTNSSNRFVQILNVGDHWTCLTNIFSNNLNEVFVYNSRLSEFLITQLYCQRHFSGDMTTTVRRIHSVYGNFSSKRNKQDYAVTMQQLQQLHAATSSLLVSHLTKSFYSKKYMTE